MKLYRTTRKSLQRGQAFAETLASFGVIGLFLTGAHYLWIYGELKQTIIDATRFAAWERTVWESYDNGVEKFAVHKTDASLANSVVIHQLSTPKAWVDFRKNIKDGGAKDEIDTVKVKNLKKSISYFVSKDKNPYDLIVVETVSSKIDLLVVDGLDEITPNPSGVRGFEPTNGYTTSLELDQKMKRTIKTKFNSQLLPSTVNRIFSFFMLPVDVKKKLSLITNTWEASPPVNFVRTERQLLPFSTGHAPSGTPPNRLAYINYVDGGQTRLAGFSAFMEYLGGANGLGGQTLVTKLGINAKRITSFAQQGGEGWDPEVDVPKSGNILKAQHQLKEYFNPNAVSAWQHRHTFVIDNSTKTASEGIHESTDATIGKRKYKAISYRNPIQYYSAPTE